MQKIKIVVDSPSDIPDDDLARYGIDMVGVPIAVDGEDYVERESFSITDFYPILERARKIPTTSRVPIKAFTGVYQKALDEGYTDIIVITINAGGSGTHESAQMAARQFLTEGGEAVNALSIHIVDSMTYCIAYGYPAVQAAIMAEKGAPLSDVLEYLRDIFSRIEICLVCYTLEYAKKSGRITAAAAIMGDAIGLKPTIAMIDGKTEITSKVRGGKKATQKLLDIYRQQRINPDDPVLVVSAKIDEYGQVLKAQLEQELNREVPHYKAGAAITINAGPCMAALCFLSAKRERNERDQPSVISYNGIDKTEICDHERG